MYRLIVVLQQRTIDRIDKYRRYALYSLFVKGPRVQRICFTDTDIDDDVCKEKTPFKRDFQDEFWTPVVV